MDINYGILQDHPFTKERVTTIGAQLAQMHVDVTPKMVATVTNAKRFAVLDGGVPGAKSIVMGDVVCATLSDPDGSRSQAIVKTLNLQLDAGLQIFQVGQNEDSVLIKDRPVPDHDGGRRGAGARAGAGGSGERCREEYQDGDLSFVVSAV